MQYEPLIEEVWSEDSEGEGEPDRRVQPAERRRTSPNSAAVVDQRVAAAASYQMPTSVSVRHSKHVRFGPTIVSVTHNENVETVKARFLCLELETEKQAKRLRSSVACCVCWTLLVTFLLAVYMFFLVTGHRTRLDIGLNETWYVRREGWLAMDVSVEEVLKLPVPLVIIAHTEHLYCNTNSACKNLVHEMQDRELQGRYGDIVPNFLVGGNGLILEGRGANVVGFLMPARARTLITISFIGDYGRDSPDAAQFAHVAELLAVLVRDGVLREDYTLLGYCQLTPHVTSPGHKIVKKLNFFRHWNSTNVSKCLPQYLVTFLKGTTITERLSFYIVLLLILFSISIGLYYKFKIRTGKNMDSLYPWYVTRSDWMAQETNRTNSTASYSPLRLVVIQNTITHECHKYIDCATGMKELQHTFLTEKNQDIPYNFFVGNDGRVYEGRGWGLQGIHSMQFDPCALVIGFIGDYREEIKGHGHATETQLNNTLKLLEIGVEQNYLHPDYVVLGAKDLIDSESPGSNLHNAIKKWKHYDPEHRYKELTCDQIHFLKSNAVLDVAPHEWQISREMWHAAPCCSNTTPITDYEPIRLVVIHNTVSRECHSFVICTIELRKIQMWYALSEEDVPYNFIIANDGRVYEARGWGLQGGHSGQLNPCSISIAFVGEYSEDSEYNSKLSEAQMNRTLMLLDQGVRLKHLDPNYVIIGAKDVYASSSPGDSLDKVIQKMEHYGHGLSYKNKTCDEVGVRTTQTNPAAPTIPSTTLTPAILPSNLSTPDVNATAAAAVDCTTPSSNPSSTAPQPRRRSWRRH